MTADDSLKHTKLTQGLLAEGRRETAVKNHNAHVTDELRPTDTPLRRRTRLASRLSEAREEMDAMGYHEMAQALGQGSKALSETFFDLDRLAILVDESVRCATILAPDGYELPPHWTVAASTGQEG